MLFCGIFAQDDLDKEVKKQERQRTLQALKRKLPKIVAGSFFRMFTGEGCILVDSTGWLSKTNNNRSLFIPQAQAAKKRLEIRRKEVLRSDPHEYANYLVSLHLLQQGLGQKG